MLRLEDKETAEFRVGDLFEVTPTKFYPGRDSEVIGENGKVPFVTTTSSGNGWKDFTILEPNNDGNCITFSDTTDTDAIFYQPIGFVGRSHVQAMRGSLNSDMTKNMYLFIVSVIKRSVGGAYSWGNKLNRESMNNTILTLPVTPTGEPDWEWMEAYIRQIEDIHVSRLKFHNDREAAILRELHPVDDATETGEPEELDLENKETAEFRVGDLFDLDSTKSGIDGIRVNNSPQEVPYITRSEGNNGISKYISPDQDSKYQKDNGNVITIGLDTQTAYYQSNDFFTGQNVHVLSHSMLNRSIALFVIPHIKKQMSKYNWGGNGATLGRLRKDVITLPATPDGEPDWEWMDAYIRQIEERERES